MLTTIPYSSSASWTLSSIPMFLLMGYIAWIVTANRMSFSWEINLGMAAHEFELFCQPLLNASTHQCEGVEILLR